MNNCNDTDGIGVFFSVLFGVIGYILGWWVKKALMLVDWRKKRNEFSE